MCLNTRGGVRYAPLCVISFSLFTPKKPKDEQLLSACYEELQSPPDRLRWCRCRAGLIQREVAERVGVHRDTYMKMENGEVDYWPQLVVDKLAELYRIPMEDLLDDYNCFLRKGQGQAVRQYREQLGMSRSEFALLLQVDPCAVRRWETMQRIMTKRIWEKCFEGKI